MAIFSQILVKELTMGVSSAWGRREMSTEITEKHGKRRKILQPQRSQRSRAAIKDRNHEE